MAQGAEEALARTRSRSTDHNERLEPQFLRAAENDEVERLAQILDAARLRGQLNENFLRIGLTRAAEKGKINATQYLLSEGARPEGAVGNRLSPLMRAVQRYVERGFNSVCPSEHIMEADAQTHSVTMSRLLISCWHMESILRRGIRKEGLRS
jgi:hypothetical protein